MRDVVVIGWWAREQRRPSFVQLLMTELRCRLPQAKDLLDGSLVGKPIVLTVSDGRALILAAEIAALGAEVRVLSGARAASAAAAAEFATLVAALALLAASPTTDRDAAADLAARIRADLRVGAPPGEVGADRCR